MMLIYINITKKKKKNPLIHEVLQFPLLIKLKDQSENKNCSERERERERERDMVHVANMSWAKPSRRVQLPTSLKRTHNEIISLGTVF